MNELIEKISAYDLLNSLIPGGALVYFMGLLGYFDISNVNIFFLCIFAYILGVVGSRVGSIILEPVAIRFKKIHHDYGAYTSAQRSDEKLATLTAISNMYRSLAGSLVVLVLLFLGSFVPVMYRCELLIAYGILCFVLFLASWIKQERYIAERIRIDGGDFDDNN